MTRLEHDSWPQWACPCAAGHVLKEVHSTDYRYDTPQISYSFSCARCASAWRIDYGTLILRESERELADVEAKLKPARRELRALATDLVADYFEHFAAKTKKAELDEMQRLGICTQKYAAYSRCRREGRAPADLVNGLANFPWLLGLATARNKGLELATLRSSVEKWGDAAETAAKRVVRRRLESLTSLR